MPETATTETPDRYRLIETRFSPAIDPDDAIDVSCFMSTDAVDEDNEVVLPGGCDLGRFKKNGPLMVAHDWQKQVSYYPLPVGQVLWAKIRPAGILGGIRFARGSEMGREVKALVDEQILRGVSVGMRILEQSPMTRAEADSRSDWKTGFERAKGRVNVIRRWKLLELSVVPIPCNEDALIETLRVKGLPRPKWVVPVTAKETPVSDETVTDETPTEPVPDGKPFDEPDPEPDTAAKAVSDDEEDDASEDDGPVRKGHFVKCVKGPNRGVVGKVKAVHRAGLVPDVEEDVVATKAEPAVRVCCYKAMGDGHAETAHHVGCKAAHVERIDDLKPPRRAKAVTPAKAKAFEVEVLPGEIRTDAEAAAERAAARRAALTPDAVRVIAKSVLDELTGVV